ncbi:MAG: hypothetical protein KJ025_14945 [Burkholderiales bacterium]|nr:hypothetical protein [Burkholderiales bacterium]
MNRIVPATIVSLSFLVAACGSEDAPTSRSGTQEPVTAGEVKQKASEAAGTAATYARQQQQEFVAEAQTELDQIEARIAEWKAKAESAGADAKASMNESLQDLEEQRRAAEQKLSELESSGAEAWARIKTGFDEAMDRLRQSYEKAKREFA